MGKISGLLMNVRSKGKLQKPSLMIHASVEAPGRYGPSSIDDSKYQLEQIKRLAKEIRQMEAQVGSLDPDEVLRKAKKSLRIEIASKKARLMECQARLGTDDDDEDEEE